VHSTLEHALDGCDGGRELGRGPPPVLCSVILGTILLYVGVGRKMGGATNLRVGGVCGVNALEGGGGKYSKNTKI